MQKRLKTFKNIQKYSTFLDADYTESFQTRIYTDLIFYGRTPLIFLSKDAGCKTKSYWWYFNGIIAIIWRSYTRCTS